MTQSAIQPAFRDPSRDAQAAFRAIMSAMALPGRIVGFRGLSEAPAPLSGTAAAILLTLADYETPLWLDARLSKSLAATDFIRFHTGARFAATPEEAAFAIISEPLTAPSFAAFAQGTAQYPDRSTTVIFQVEQLSQDDWRLAGPGIAGETAFRATPLPMDFPAQLKDNHTRFPLGVDVIFAGQGEIAALPRSTRILEAH